MSTDKKDVFIDQNAVAAADARIRASRAMTSGVMSSWAKPMEGISGGPQGKITVPKTPEPHQEPVKTKPSLSPTNGLVEIPMQAMKQFKVFLAHTESVNVLLTPEQAKMMADLISQMPTPKKMSDTKAIVKLSDQLEAVVANL